MRHALPARAESFRLPIVALTAHAGKEDRDECLAAGMDDWLPKPFSMDQLDRVLTRWAPWAQGKVASEERT